MNATIAYAVARSSTTVEGTETVSLTLDNGIAGSVNIVENAPPRFRQASYTQKVGYDRKSGTVVIEVSRMASDPEGRPMRYSLLGGEGIVAIDPLSGDIRLTTDALEATQESYILDVSAYDDAQQWAHASVTLTLVPAVAITGDYHAIEGTADTITLTFLRITKADPATAGELAVNVSFPWGDGTGNTIATNDFESVPSELATRVGQHQRVTIPAGQPSVTYSLTARQDSQSEAIETLTVQLADGDGYAVLNDTIDLPKEGRPNGDYWARLHVVDGVTLFAGLNANPNLADGPGQDIAQNDLIQGQLGDCTFLAAVGALIHGGRTDRIRELFSGTDEAQGVFKVKLWDAEIQDWRHFQYGVDILSRGTDMCKLSGDTSNANGTGLAEVWTVVLERAWIDLNAGEVEGGQTHEPWRALLGPAGQFGQYNVTGWSNQQIWDLIRDALSAGKQVNVVSRSDIGNYLLPDRTTLAKNHVYWADFCTDGPSKSVKLLNPHGPTSKYPFANVPFDLLDVLIGKVLILDVLS